MIFPATVTGVGTSTVDTRLPQAENRNRAVSSLEGEVP
jgi:hypothetical protein